VGTRASTVGLESTMTSRRALLASVAALAAASRSGDLLAVMPGARNARFLAARRHGSRHEAALFDSRARDLAVLALPDRGHSFAIDATGERAVVFGRQPGFFALAFSLADGHQLGSLALPAERHFFGHGVFSSDGSRLFATENDFANGSGVIGVYDARAGAKWKRLGEFVTGGIGPHEVVLMPDGGTLCVANGGLLTHPDYGKEPLNRATMRPSLAYLDAGNGRLLERIELPPELFQLSIRHLATDGRGAVWFACQHEGPATQQPPLLGRHRRGAQPELFSGPPAVLRGLRNYLGSVAIDTATDVLVTSSPVGGHVAFWSAVDGRSLGSVARPDGCGVAACGSGQFLVSDGFGAMIATGPDGRKRQLMGTSPELAWDNHLRSA
jgi:hypothetical protein